MKERLQVLDGWRAISILLVLAAHLLPLGPKSLQLNETAGPMGMALFFTLSGFLIIRFLGEGMPLWIFATRRLARIVPLAWLTVGFLLLANDTGLAVPNLLFYANLPPAKLLYGGEHLWSICVEMQFYALAALLCFLPSRRGLYLVPVLCIAVTGLRILHGATVSIVTWHRVDEILAGGTVALIYLGWFGERPKTALRALNIWPFAVLLIVSSHPATGAFQYLRPYAAAGLVAVSLYHVPAFVSRILSAKPMAYIAEISYALYIIHGVLTHTWLGSGETVERYLKRPLLFAATFLLAHLSTRYFERPITRYVHMKKRSLATAPAV